MTAIKTLIYLLQLASENFDFIPQLDIFKNYDDIKPETDLDIICMVNSEFYIGECKHNSDAFSKDAYKSLKSIANIALQIRPDKIILSCNEDPSNRLETSKNYLENLIKSWDGKPDIITYQTRKPDDFYFTSSRYFFY